MAFPYTYNASPGAVPGAGTYGLVPGQISLPSPFSDLANVYPNLSETNAAVSGNELAGLRGQLNLDDLTNNARLAAMYGVTSGQPGSVGIPGSLNSNQSSLSNILSSYQIQQNAMKQFPGLLSSVSQTQTLNPAEQISVAGTNAFNAALPDPTAQATAAEDFFNRYMQAQAGPAGGTGVFRGGAGFGQSFGNNIYGNRASDTARQFSYFGGGSRINSPIPGVGFGEGSAPSWMNVPSSYLTFNRDPFANYSPPVSSYNDVPDYSYFSSLG